MIFFVALQYKNTTTMEKSLFDDTRTGSDFKGITYSGFKCTIVVQRLADAMMNEKLENACYWCAELMCSGHYMELWETLIQFYCKYIHISNPKLSIYMATKINRFRENMNEVETEQEQIDFRNDPGFRSLFIELVVILSLSSKKYTLQAVKVKQDDFNMVNFKDRLHAPDLSFGEKILSEDDPKELMIAINELAFNLSEKEANTMRAYYWYEWIIEYSKICKKNKQVCRIAKRSEIETILVDDKWSTNPVWLVWILLKDVATKRGKIHEKIVNSLFQIFSLRYTDGCNTKRRVVVYFAISVLTTNIIFSEHEIIKDKTVLSCVLSQMHGIFSQVKEHGNRIKQEQDKEKEETEAAVSNHDTSVQQGLYMTITDTPEPQPKKRTKKTNAKKDEIKNVTNDMFSTDFLPRV